MRFSILLDTLKEPKIALNIRLSKNKKTKISTYRIWILDNSKTAEIAYPC